MEEHPTGCMCTPCIGERNAMRDAVATVRRNGLTQPGEIWRYRDGTMDRIDTQAAMFINMARISAVRNRVH